jgi:putative flippase GtrA
MVSHHGQALVVFGITYAATTVSLALLGVLAPDAGTLVQTAVVAVANVLSTAVRFVAMRRWIFAPRERTMSKST